MSRYIGAPRRWMPFISTPARRLGGGQGSCEDSGAAALLLHCCGVWCCGRAAERAARAAPLGAPAPRRAQRRPAAAPAARSGAARVLPTSPAALQALGAPGRGYHARHPPPASSSSGWGCAAENQRLDDARAPMRGSAARARSWPARRSAIFDLWGTDGLLMSRKGGKLNRRLAWTGWRAAAKGGGCGAAAIVRAARNAARCTCCVLRTAPGVWLRRALLCTAPTLGGAHAHCVVCKTKPLRSGGERRWQLSGGQTPAEPVT